MQDIRYLRGQASLCLEIARLMSDPKVAQNFRASAAQYFARAAELEMREETREEAIDSSALRGRQ